MSEELRQKIVKKGNKLVVKRDMPDLELTAKDVLTNLDGLRGQRDKIKHQMEGAKRQLEEGRKYIEELNDREKDLNKFELWARDTQKSKLKSLVDKYHEVIVEEVLADETEDPGRTQEQLLAERFLKYQGKMARHKDIAEGIAPSIIREFLYEKTILKHPWKE